MLKLANTNDYPEVFRTGTPGIILTTGEQDWYDKLKGFTGRRNWTLKRVLLKELSSTFMNQVHKRWYPLNTFEVGDRGHGPLYPITAKMLDSSKPVLMGAADVCESTGIGFITDILEKLSIGLRIRRVKNEYPFSLDEADYTPEEESFIRSQSLSVINQYVSLIGAVKELVNEITPEGVTATPSVTSITAAETIILNDFKPGAGFDEYLIRFWSHEDFIIVMCAFFSRDHHNAVHEAVETWK